MRPRDQRQRLLKGAATWPSKPRGAGCRDCRNSGYRGRLGVFEMLMITNQLRGMIVERRSATDLQVVARKDGLKLMREDGGSKVLAGMTTVEEIVRVTKTDVSAIV